MKKVILTTLALLATLTMFVGFVQAFELIELFPFVSYTDPDSGNSLSMYHVHHVPDINEPEIEFNRIVINAQFPNTGHESLLEFHDDGRVTLNGKGICLDDGSSSNGGTCPSGLVAHGEPLPLP